MSTETSFLVPARQEKLQRCPTRRSRVRSGASSSATTTHQLHANLHRRRHRIVVMEPNPPRRPRTDPRGTPDQRPRCGARRRPDRVGHQPRHRDPNHAASPDGAQGSLTDPGEASVGGTGTSDRRLRTGLTQRPDGRSDVPRGDRSPRKHDKDPVRLCTIIVDKRWTNPRYGANRTQRTGQPNGRRAEAPRDLPSGVTAVRAPPCWTAPEPPAAVIDDVTIATPTGRRRAPGGSGPARTKPHTDPQTQITANRFRGGVWCTRKKTQGRRSADEHPS